MAKRSLASIWARSLKRTWKAAASSGVKAARKGLVSTPVKTLLKAGRKAGTKAGSRAGAKSLLRPLVKSGAKALAKALVNPRPKTLTGGDWISGVAMAPAGARRYQLFKPAGVTTLERLPLLVMLHGCTQDAQEFADSTRMNRIAARERFLVLYPEQEPTANPHRCWNWYGTASGQAHGEAAILLAAIDQVCRLYPVDPQRVALAGLSAGASMAALLAAREPERFKALVMHSGIPPGTAHSAVSAISAMHGHRPTAALAPAEAAAAAVSWPPLLVIQGADDGTVAPTNGRAAAEFWADALDAKRGASRRLQRGQRHPMTVTDFRRGGRSVVSLCEIDRLGHAWSGGDARLPYADAAGPDASRMVWAFAARQFGPPTPRAKP